MIHGTEVDGFPGSLADLAQKLGNLRYDALALFLRELAAKLQTDASADANRGRARLAQELQTASAEARFAAEAIERAWKICEPHMRG